MDNRNGGPTSKVTQLIDEYELDGISDELKHRWTQAEDRVGLRHLSFVSDWIETFLPDVQKLR